MDLDISARSSLTAQLLDPVTGLSGLESIGLNFGSRDTEPLAGIVSLAWVPATGKVMAIDLSAELDITSDTTFGPDVQTIQAYAGSDVPWVQDLSYFEVALVADPLALDAYGNPISASRASELTLTIKDDADATRGVATLAVTRAGQVAIYRHAGRLPGVQMINQIAISGVTATPCKLYIIFGGISGA